MFGTHACENIVRKFWCVSKKHFLFSVHLNKNMFSTGRTIPSYFPPNFENDSPLPPCPGHLGKKHPPILPVMQGTVGSVKDKGPRPG